MEVLIYVIGAFGTLFWIAMCVFSLVSHHRDLALWAACCAALCVVLGGFGWYQNVLWKGDQDAIDKTPPFSAKYSWTDDNGPTPWIWMVQDGLRAPIYCAMMTTLTNTSSRSFMVDTFIVEEQRGEGEFKKISPGIGTARGTFYFGSDPRAVRVMTFVTLESAIQNKNIIPGESVRGWVFYIKHPEGKLRFTLMNSLGDVSRKPFTALVTNEPGGNPGFPMQPMLNDIVRDKTFDISTVPEIKNP